MEQTSLPALRETKGLKIAEIISAARGVDPDFPGTHAGYLGIEENGTRDYWKIKALSSVFGLSMDAFADIVKPSPRPKKM